MNLRILWNYCRTAQDVAAGRSYHGASRHRDGAPALLVREAAGCPQVPLSLTVEARPGEGFSVALNSASPLREAAIPELLAKAAVALHEGRARGYRWFLGKGRPAFDWRLFATAALCLAIGASAGAHPDDLSTGGIAWVAQAAIARPMPGRAFPGQKPPPCDPREAEIGGGCWLWASTFSPPCGKFYEHDGKCYAPIRADGLDGGLGGGR
jgi:hypothetical protein